MGSTRHTVLSIQLLRFVAASLVVAHHSYQAAENALLSGAYPTSSYLFSFGAVGVHVFFVISGYIICLTSYASDRGAGGRDIAIYMYRRIVRIYPVYWIFVATYVVVRFWLNEEYALTPETLLGCLLLWPGYAAEVIGPAWTLSFEAYFYLCFGVSMLFGYRKGPIVLSAFFLLCMAAARVVHPSTPVGGLATNALLLEFMAGIWIARITSGRKLPRWLGLAAVAVSVALFAVGLLLGYDRVPVIVSWGPPSALLVFGLVIVEQTGRVPGTSWFSRFGNSSYSLYLSHVILIDLVLLALASVGVRLPALVAVGLIVVVAIAFAHGFYLSVERHVVRGLQHLVGRGAGREKMAEGGLSGPL